MRWRFRRDDASSVIVVTKQPERVVRRMGMELMLGIIDGFLEGTESGVVGGREERLKIGLDSLVADSEDFHNHRVVPFKWSFASVTTSRIRRRLCVRSARESGDVSLRRRFSFINSILV